MNRIKKGYLPYLIGEIACCVAEIVLFFFALYSDSLFAVIVALIAIAATGVGVWYAYKKSASHAAATRVTEKKKGVRAAYHNIRPITTPRPIIYKKVYIYRPINYFSPPRTDRFFITKGI